MLRATQRASWRILTNTYVLDEVEWVMSDYLGSSRRLARLTRGRCLRRATPVEGRPARHGVADDPDDSHRRHQCPIEFSGLDEIAEREGILLFARSGGTPVIGDGLQVVGLYQGDRRSVLDEVLHGEDA